jgi:hypothetical protein
MIQRCDADVNPYCDEVAAIDLALTPAKCPILARVCLAPAPLGLAGPAAIM